MQANCSPPYAIKALTGSESFPAMEYSFHYSILERLGIGWRDSVCQSNEKRVREYDRQQEEAFQCLGASEVN